MLWQISVLFLIWILQYLWAKRRIIQLFRTLKNDLSCVPILGHMHLFIGSDEDRMNAFKLIEAQAIKHGGVTSILAINRLYTAVADVEIAEFVLKHCLEKDDIVRFSREVLGNGSIFAPVSIWRPRRKILASNFSQKKLNYFVEIFSRQSQTMVQQLQPMVGSGPFSIFQYLTTYTLDSVCENTLGAHVNSQLNPDKSFLKSFDEGCHLIAARMCQPWLYSDFVYKLTPFHSQLMMHKKVICDFVSQMIQTKCIEMKIQAENKDKSEAKTFLEMLIQSSGGDRGYSDIELLEETLVIVIAGTDTSAVGASFTAVMLSKHMDVQDKVYKEIKEVFGDSDRPLVAEDLPKLKYLEVVIKETLRLYPPVPVIVRKVEEDLLLPSGLTLVKDTGVIMMLGAINRNPKYWGSDADSFRPERFIDTPYKHHAQYMPFSNGPRNCLGYQYAMMSTKTALVSLLRKYKLTPANPNNPEKSLRVKFQLMLKDVNNFRVQLEERN